MKKLLISLSILGLSVQAQAAVFIVYDKDTKEVKSISNQDDCVIQKGWEKTVLEKENYQEYVAQLSNPADCYKLNGNKLVTNLQKIDKMEQDKIKNEEAGKEEEMIQKKMRKEAIKALKAEGKTFKHIKDVNE